MGQLNLPQNLTTAKPPTSVPPPSKFKPKDEDTEPKKTEEAGLSVMEKIKLFFIIIAAVTIPVFCTFSLTRYSHQTELQKYKELVVDLKNQINVLTNPAIKQVEQYESILKAKQVLYNKEKEELEKDPAYQSVIKKTKELDKQIIICNVHLHNIEIVKQNNYNEVDNLLEKLNKENIK